MAARVPPGFRMCVMVQPWPHGTRLGGPMARQTCFLLLCLDLKFLEYRLARVRVFGSHTYDRCEACSLFCYAADKSSILVGCEQ